MTTTGSWPGSPAGISTFRVCAPAGYAAAEQLPGDAALLTPPSTLRTLHAGYRAVLHPSAQP